MSRQGTSGGKRREANHSEEESQSSDVSASCPETPPCSPVQRERVSFLDEKPESRRPSVAFEEPTPLMQAAAERLYESNQNSSRGLSEESRKTGWTNPNLRCVPDEDDLSPKLICADASVSSSGTASALQSDIPYEFEQRVVLHGPDGPIVMNVWDLSKFRYWRFDHYQELRREWQAQRENTDAVVRRFAIPHPGVDYYYHRSRYTAHAGNVPLTCMAAQCLLPDGSSLSPDVDFRRQFKLQLEAANQLRLCGAVARLPQAIAGAAKRIVCPSPRMPAVKTNV